MTHVGFDESTIKIRQGEESARLQQELRPLISIKRAPGWQSPLQMNVLRT